MEQGARATRQRPLVFAMAVAFALHLLGLGALALWRPVPAPGTSAPAIEVTLAAPAPESGPAPAGDTPVRVASQPPPPPVPVALEDRSHRAREVAAVPAERPPPETSPARAARESPPPRAVVRAPDPAGGAVTPEARARARAVIGRLGRFRLTEPSEPLEPAEPLEPVAPVLRGPAVLGAAPQGETLAMVLDHDALRLPSGETALALEFYSGGVRGDFERLGDAVTRSFGFRTPGGVEVKCTWMVVIFACGW